MKNIIPSKKQYAGWTLPSKYSAWGLVISISGLVASIVGLLVAFGYISTKDSHPNYIKIADKSIAINAAYYMDYNAEIPGSSRTVELFLTNGLIDVSIDDGSVLANNATHILHLSCTDRNTGEKGIFEYKEYYSVLSVGSPDDSCDAYLVVDSDQDKFIRYAPDNYDFASSGDFVSSVELFAGTYGYVSFSSENSVKFNFSTSDDVKVEGKYEGKISQLDIL